MKFNPVMPTARVVEQSNEQLANRLIKDCNDACNESNCDAQQAAKRLTEAQ